MWVFPKIVVRQNGWFIMESLIKRDDLGVPLFSETPMWLCMCFDHLCVWYVWKTCRTLLVGGWVSRTNFQRRCWCIPEGPYFCWFQRNYDSFLKVVVFRNGWFPFHILYSKWYNLWVKKYYIIWPDSRFCYSDGRLKTHRNSWGKNPQKSSSRFDCHEASTAMACSFGSFLWLPGKIGTICGENHWDNLFGVLHNWNFSVRYS